MTPQHLETIRELANAPDREGAEIDEITLRAALGEMVVENAKLTAMLDDTLRAERELQAAADPDVCWHCRSVLVPEPAHCDQCPAFGCCSVLGCDEPGCNDEAPGDDEVHAVFDCRAERDLRLEVHRLRRLLRRVIDEDRDPAALRKLSQDIATELGVPDPLAQN